MKMILSYRKKINSGFTLIELLIVITIINFLASIGIPQYVGVLEKARKAEAVGTMAGIRRVALMYYANEGIFPSAATGETLSVDFDGDDKPEAEIQLLDTPRFDYSITGGDTGTITAIDEKYTSYEMDVATGEVTTL